jgi:phosphopantetheine--protein transferase-like protein
MSDAIKEVVAGFVKIKPELVTESTLITSKAVFGSIQLHRMYAALAQHGVAVDDYRNIQTYGELMQRVNGNSQKNTASNDVPLQFNYNPSSNGSNNSFSVGIDVEPIDSFKSVNDFREDPFYQMNFSPSEISYCLLQSHPLASFAGLFAAKEAIVKADNHLKGTAFSSINIEYHAGGKPFYPGFQISITHSDNIAIAVAVQLPLTAMSAAANDVLRLDPIPLAKRRSWQLPLALLLSVAAIILWLITWFLA